MKNRSVMLHNFSQVPSAEIPRSKFDRSHGHKTAFDAAYLIPIYVDEALPADTFTMSTYAFARLATPIKPIMDNLFMDFFFFAIPLRLVWTNFPKFMGEQTNPGDSTSYLCPTATSPAGGYSVGSLQDYMGIPPGIVGIEHNNLFMRAYNLTYNTWFRDENLQNSVVVDMDDGPDTVTDYVLLKRGKRHDYFTSCLPWPQKGTAVFMPLGTSAPVKSDGTAIQVRGNVDAMSLLVRSAAAGNTAVNIQQAGTNGVSLNWGAAGATTTGLYADLNAATAATINQLRQSFQIQKLLERDARGGTRLTEIIRAHFGVTSPDARLQRPEYLGGGSTQVIVSQVPQTSSTDATTPQGNLSAFGAATVRGQIGFSKSFTEHCIILGLVSVRADLTYQQGLNRMFSRSTRYDFAWPALAHIGEQSVFRKEIWSNGVDNDDNTIFGYQERFAEYRYKPSVISGILRSDAAGTLDSWHLSQDFGAAPVLNAAFIVEDPPVDRVIAVPSQPHFIFDGYFRLFCARPLPVYGVPGFIDRF